MANKGSQKAKIDGDLLLQAITNRGYSLRQLASEPEIARSDRTIRTALKEGEIQLELLYRICWALGLNMQQLMQNAEEGKVNQNRYEMMIVRYSSYFRMLLSMFGVSMTMYYELSEEKKYHLQKDLCKNISDIIWKYFSKHFQDPDTKPAMDEMDDFIDEYQGAFEPQKIQEIQDAMDRGYEEYMRNNPPSDERPVRVHDASLHKKSQK